jgi:Domain of unknown function (DUF4384)
MKRKVFFIGMAAAALTTTLAQEPPRGARNMYFVGLESRPARGGDGGGTADVASRRRTESERRTTAAAGRRSPLGLRYTILKVVGTDKVEMLPQTAFQSGDGIQLRIEPNDDGYLYIVHQGTSGNWQFLFPHPKANDGSNRVDRGKSYILPPNSLMRFSGKPGIEKLFVVLSRVPEQNLDQFIYGGSTPRPAEMERESTRPQQPVLMASNQMVGDPVIGRLRNAHTRDLVLETISDDSSARSEKAVYVVNPSGSADARVVADIQLRHK